VFNRKDITNRLERNQ